MHLVERTVTKPWTGQSGAQFPVMARDFALLQNVQTSNGVQPASYSVSPKGCIPGDKVPGVGRSVDTQAQYQASIYRIYGGQSARGTGYHPSTLFSPTTITPPKLHTHSFKMSLQPATAAVFKNTTTYMNDWSYISTPPICLYDMKRGNFTFKILQYSMPT